MNLRKKKQLIARTLDVGKDRIILNVSRLNEIKEAITKQDIRDLAKGRAILLKDVKGRRKKKVRKTKKRQGKKKMKINARKQDYVKLTRKLRGYIKILKEKDRLSNENYRKLRKQIRAKIFKSLANLKEHLEGEK